MLLETQLKRGYLALAGMACLSLGLAILPTASGKQFNLLSDSAELKDCGGRARPQWKLAATPIDMPVMPRLKVRLCQA